MTRSDPLQGQYDETPYQDEAFPQFDLARLLGLARLFQLGPEPNRDEPVRVLDLGCASGVHLREQAARYPAARFTGIDFSAAELKSGRQAIAEAGLTNVELIQGDLRDAEIPTEEFDLVLCHGIFSWVPDDVKESIFRHCRTGLRPGGIAAIAYVTYPGWKQREAIRELLALRVQNIEKPDERIRQSALMLRFLHSGYSSMPDSSQSQYLKEIVEGMQRSPSNVFFHDELGREHDPCYFLQFAQWAADSGLAYFAECDLSTMSLQNLPTESRSLLQEIAPDFLETQQILDFIVNRSGRSSLLVRDDAETKPELGEDFMEELLFTTDLQVDSLSGPSTEGPLDLRSARGHKLTIRDPLMKKTLLRLIDMTPEPLSLASMNQLGESDAKAENVNRLSGRLLELIKLGLVEPRLDFTGA